MIGSADASVDFCCHHCAVISGTPEYGVCDFSNPTVYVPAVNPGNVYGFVSFLVTEMAPPTSGRSIHPVSTF